MTADIIIIGGGPAGLIAACRASELGAKVVLLEKNKQPGLKLLITGGGRCNITNYLEDYKELANYYGQNGRFLLSAFSKFGAIETINFFEEKGIKTKVEENKRVFPVSDKARDVLEVLSKHILKNKGEIKTSATVKKIVVKDNLIKKVILTNGEELSAKNYILATGGKSYPLTGSTGDGYHWLKIFGHNIIKPRPGLTPIVIKDFFIKNLEGLSLSGIKLSLFENDKKIISVNGDIIFTARGVSGPAVLHLSNYLGKTNNHYLLIDLFSEIKEVDLDKNLQELFKTHGKKDFQNVLLTLIRPKMLPVIIKLGNFQKNKKVSLISKDERKVLVNLLKNFKLNILNIESFDKAMVTIGGLDLREVDPKTMHSKLISNLFIAGELLDLNGPTGGYNLQICWSTGYVAGEEAT